MSLRSFLTLPFATSPSPSPSLSQSTPTSPLPGESDPTWLGPGLLGFLSLLFLAVAVFVIYRSMNKQLKRVTFDEDAVNAVEPETTGVADGAPVPAGGTASEGSAPEAGPRTSE